MPGDLQCLNGGSVNVSKKEGISPVLDEMPSMLKRLLFKV